MSIDLEGIKERAANGDREFMLYAHSDVTALIREVERLRLSSQRLRTLRRVGEEMAKALSEYVKWHRPQSRSNGWPSENWTEAETQLVSEGTAALTAWESTKEIGK